jgi:hypothetical protein
MNIKMYAAVFPVLFAGSQLLVIQAQAAPLSAKTVFVLCANAQDGAFVVRAKKCKKNETRVSMSNLATFGAVGPTGAAGATGPSAFEAIPSGTTIRGAVGLDAEAPKTTGDFRVAVSFPAKLTQKLNDADFLFASTSVIDNDCTGGIRCTTNPFSPLCTGTANNPTAPAGKVCIYIERARNARNIDAFDLADDSAAEVTTGFYFIFSVDGDIDDIYAVGTWAYTAP